MKKAFIFGLCLAASIAFGQFMFGPNGQAFQCLPAVSGGGGAPSFGSFIGASAGIHFSESDITITVTNAVPAGYGVAAAVGVINVDMGGVSSVTDTRGNTWTLAKAATNGTSSFTYLETAVITTALQVNDTIVFHFGLSPGSANTSECAVSFNNVTAVDSSASNTGTSGTGNPCVISASTVSAKTGSAAFICAASSAYTSPNWTYPFPILRFFVSYTTASSAGAQDPGGTIDVFTQWSGAWVAFK